MQIAQKIREGKLTHDERCDLVSAAKDALRRSGATFTKFIWRGVLLNYGLTDRGAYVINEADTSEETEWAIVTKDPYTGIDPIEQAKPQ
jgi:hypothetical protein